MVQEQQLESRYGSPRFIRRVDEDTFVIYGESRYFRVGEEFFDFEGGPFILIGMKASLLGLKDDRRIVSVKALDCEKEGYAECMVKLEHDKE
jgi:hypothetical protein